MPPFYVGNRTLGGERCSNARDVNCSTKLVLVPQAIVLYGIGSNLERNSTELRRRDPA